MKQKKYFVGYAYNQGFGNAFFDADKFTRDNCEVWIKEIERKLKENKPDITEKIILLNI